MSINLAMRDLYKTALFHVEALKEKNKYLIPSFIGGGLAILLLIAGFLYYSHMQQKEAAAQLVLSECIEEYNRAREGQSEWSSAELMCRAGHDKFSNTKTALYFMPFRVDALLALDQRENALTLLQQFVSRLPANSPLGAVYKTKLALLKLDDAQTCVQESGLQELRALADDVKNINRDLALYYVAEYYSMHNQPELAQAAFTQLQSLPTKPDISSQSPWVATAQEMFGASR